VTRLVDYSKIAAPKMRELYAVGDEVLTVDTYERIARRSLADWPA
jgi:hypothetical protein